MVSSVAFGFDVPEWTLQQNKRNVKSATLSAPSIHASCVLVGAGAVLIRGASGAGKSRLAHDLIEAGSRGDVAFARLVADDRTLVEAVNGRLLARPAPALTGLLELRHIGIRAMPFEPACGRVTGCRPHSDGGTPA